MSAVSIAHVDPQCADAMALLHEASVDARALYPELFGADSPDATNAPLEPRGVYVIAYLDGSPLACGALRPLDASTAEIRRMYVHRDHRRRGLAAAVLAFLLREASRLGYGRLVLETGCRQTPAMRLYERSGFERIAPFGEYVDDPGSVCYARRLPFPQETCWGYDGAGAGGRLHLYRERAARVPRGDLRSRRWRAPVAGRPATVLPGAAHR